MNISDFFNFNNGFGKVAKKKENPKAGHKKKATFEMDGLPLEGLDDEPSTVDDTEFRTRLDMLTRLKSEHPFIYEAAVTELKDKANAGQPFKEWGPESIQKLLSELGE